MATPTKRRHAAGPRKDPKAKKGRQWYFIVDGPPHPDGSRNQIRRRGFATREAAQAVLDGLRVDVRQGNHVDRSDITVGEYLSDWMERLDGKVRRSTASSYRSTLRLHVVERIGGVKLQKLTPMDLETLYADLAKPGAYRGGKRDESGAPVKPRALSSRTIEYVHVVLNRALREAVNHGLILSNPAAKATRPTHRPDPADMKAWSRAELETFLRARKEAGDPLYAMWRLIAATGMRRGEAAGLQVDDLDLESGRLHVRRSRVVVNHEVFTEAPKTAAGARSIGLDDLTLEALRAHVGASTGDGWMFTDELGGPLHPDTGISDRFEKHVASAGVRRIGIHGLRHTYATLALEAGVSPRIVQKRLGHSSVAITLGTYSHVSDATDLEAAERVAALFS